MKVKSQSEVAQSCPTLSDPLDCSLPGSSVHGIFQARVLEWSAIAQSKSNEKKQPGEPEQEHPFETCDHQEQERILDIAQHMFSKEE